jgi:signal transduction histidine kinase
MEQPTTVLAAQRLRYLLATGIIMLLCAVVIAFVIPVVGSTTDGTYLLLAILTVLLVFLVLTGRINAASQSLQHPGRSAVYKVVQLYGPVLREVAEARQLAELAARALFSTLDATSAAVWMYQSEDNTLTLAHFEGLEAANDGDDLPVDLDVKHLLTTGSVAALPESALRRAWMALGVQTVCPLRWRDQLIGMIGLGAPRMGSGYSAEAVRVLEWLADQTAWLVKTLQLAAEVEETRDHLQVAYRQTIEVQEEERRGLAAELHDDILGRLTTMGLTLRNCRKQLGASSQPVDGWLEQLEKETYGVNQRLREITQGLHPTVLTNLGLISAIQAYLDTIARQPQPASAPQVITLTAQGFNGDRVPDIRLERDLYHITRQALDNAVAHARAAQVFIHFRWSSDAVSVTVQDTGRGMPDAPERLMGQGGHLGLISMQERVRAWGGRLTLDSAPGRGTTVRASIPVRQPSRSPAHLLASTHHLSRPTA